MELRTQNLRGRAVVRDSAEAHRASTPLELFFDLTFVVAVGRVAETLHDQLVQRHFREGLIGFSAMFFGVLWAWMGFTWFASAHDSDDVPHRLLTFVQIAGALTFAAGVPRVMNHRDFAVGVIGYTIMRLGLVTSWLRVARDAPDARPRAVRFGAAVGGLQVLWIAWLAVPDSLRYPTFALLALLEVSIPFFVERSMGERVFHPGHIEERYGLFTLIVLGECVLSAAGGFQTAFDEQGLDATLLVVALSALVIAFAAWWLYFDHPGHLAPTRDTAYGWGYGHGLIFAALAALGAGAHVCAEAATGHGSRRVAALAFAIPAAGYLAGLVVVMLLTGSHLGDRRTLPKMIGAIVTVVGGLTLPFAASVALTALVPAALATWMVLAGDAISQHRAATE